MKSTQNNQSVRNRINCSYLKQYLVTENKMKSCPGKRETKSCSNAIKFQGGNSLILMKRIYKGFYVFVGEYSSESEKLYLRMYDGISIYISMIYIYSVALSETSFLSISSGFEDSQNQTGIISYSHVSLEKKSRNLASPKQVSSVGRASKDVLTMMTDRDKSRGAK